MKECGGANTGAGALALEFQAEAVSSRIPTAREAQVSNCWRAVGSFPGHPVTRRWSASLPELPWGWTLCRKSMVGPLDQVGVACPCQTRPLKESDAWLFTEWTRSRLE